MAGEQRPAMLVLIPWLGALIPVKHTFLQKLLMLFMCVMYLQNSDGANKLPFGCAAAPSWMLAD